MQPFVIPSIFIATDKYSSVLSTMSSSTNTFNGRLEAMNMKSEKLFSKLTPSISQASKQFMSMVGTAAAAAAIVGGTRWSVDQLMNYEDEMQNLRSITGATDEQFAVFKKSINETAAETKKSSVTVAQAFTAIANNQPELLKDAKALGEVTKASILLSKAAKIELQPAGEAVTSILNQYGKGAGDAAKLVSVLSAGSVAGSSEIADTAEAIKSFGTVAAVAGVKIDESVALIELGSKFDKGAEAGVKFRNILLNMTGAKVLDKLALKDLKNAGVNLETVSNKALPLNARLLEMSKIANNTNAIMHVFGKENAAMAAGILTNAGQLEKMVKDVNSVGIAEEMAAINSDTLRNRIDEAKNAFVTYLTSSDNLGSGLSDVKDAIKYVSENIDTLVTVGVNAIKFFAIWKASIIATRAYMVGYNVVLGIHNALTLRSSALLKGNAIATTAAAVAEKGLAASVALSTGNLTAFNAALGIGPLGAFAIAIGVVIGAVYAFHKAVEIFDQPLNASFQRQEAIRQEAFSVMDLRDKYLALGKTLRESEKLAIYDARKNLMGGVVAAKMKLASTNEEERDQGVAETATLVSKLQQLNNFAKDPAKEFSKDRGQRYANSAEISTYVPKLSEPTQMMASPNWLDMKPAVNTKVTQVQQQAVNNTSTVNSNATLTIENKSDSEAQLQTETRSGSILPKTTSTFSMSAAK